MYKVKTGKRYLIIGYLTSQNKDKIEKMKRTLKISNSECVNIAIEQMR